MPDRAELTQAQADVLHLLARGQSYKEIALMWRVNRKTVYYHANAARDAIGARTITQAAVIYAQTASMNSPADGVNL